MGFSDEELNDIYDKTGGYCEYCRKKLAFINYGKIGARGAWEVDHSNPRSRGGTDYLRNLYPACIACNRDKGARMGRSYRSKWDRSSQPTTDHPMSLGGMLLAGLLAYATYRAWKESISRIPQR